MDLFFLNGTAAQPLYQSMHTASTSWICIDGWLPGSEVWSKHSCCYFLFWNRHMCPYIPTKCPWTYMTSIIWFRIPKQDILAAFWWWSWLPDAEAPFEIKEMMLQSMEMLHQPRDVLLDLHLSLYCLCIESSHAILVGYSMRSPMI